MNWLVVFFAQTLVAATPLVLATLGGVLSERAGIATISLEGYLLGGALGAAVGALASGSVLVALASGVLAGAVLGALFAFATVTLAADRIVSGVALNLFAVAGTRVALKVLYDSSSNSPPLLVSRAHEGSVATVALREALGEPATWLALAMVFTVRYALANTVAGLRVRSVGEHPEAARSQGVSVARVQWGALVAGGALAGAGGAHLALEQHEFVAYMSGGRGFLAIAAVILGGWRPVPCALAALAIGALGALESTLGSVVPVPPALLQALPFAATLVAVVGLVGRTRPPRALR